MLMTIPILILVGGSALRGGTSEAPGGMESVDFVTSAASEGLESSTRVSAPWVKPLALEEIEGPEEDRRGVGESTEDGLAREDRSTVLFPQKDAEAANFAGNIGIHGRWSLPLGSAERSSFTYGGVVYVTRHLAWSDLFEPGWGYDLEADIYFGDKRGAQGFNAGLVVLLQSDTYGGGRVTNSLGGNLAFSDLTMGSLLIGGTVIQAIGQGFYTKGLIALGPVHYSSVDATFTGIGFATFRNEVFENTWTISSDFRADIGYRVGPLGIVFGVGFRIQAPPSEAASTHLNSGAFWTFDLNFGLELGF